MSRFSSLFRSKKICRNVNQRLRGISVQNHDVYRDHFPPLCNPLPEFSNLSFQDSSERHPTRITVLPNGLKIASENSSGPAACIGLYVDCGSIYETDEYMGATHVLERMAFKSTRKRRHLDVLREIEATGGNVGATASREQMGYSYDVLKNYAAEAIEILIDSVRNPIFLDDEIDDQVDKLKSELTEISKDPQQFLIESLHLAGYSGALARPLIAPKEALDRLNGSLIGRFYNENYTADRMVLAAFGLDHEQLLYIAEPLLCNLDKGPPLITPQSIYIGGEIRHKEDSEKTHVAFGFEVPGGWHNEKDATTVTVLQFLLGGGGSFSAGGPGKGMHSRLYLRVLNKYQQVQSISAFSSICNDTGLFGLHMTTNPEFVPKLVEIAASELTLVATPGQVSEIEFQRAKNATKSAVLVNLESRMIVAEDIGRQLLTYGCRKPVEHFLGILDQLTLDDLRAVVTRVLSTKLTLTCFGDVDCVPTYATVCRFFDQ